MMACLPNVNAVFETQSFTPKLPNVQKKAQVIGCLSKKSEATQKHAIQTTRRVALGLASSITITGIFSIGTSLAENNEPPNNGFWYTETLPIPSIENKLANDKTGTRSFLKQGIYIANIGVKGSEYRLKKNAFDLLAMEDLIGQDTLNYVRKYLRVKSTFMYYDFDKIISAAQVNEKKPLTDLANRLFDSFEKLEDATRSNNLPQTESGYEETKAILNEVMNRMA